MNTEYSVYTPFSTGSVKRPKPNDWGPNQMINDTLRREPPKLGTKASNPSFAGVEKQTGRRHEGIRSRCSSNGAEISRMRELNKPESTLRSDAWQVLPQHKYF